MTRNRTRKQRALAKLRRRAATNTQTTEGFNVVKVEHIPALHQQHIPANCQTQFTQVLLDDRDRIQMRLCERMMDSKIIVTETGTYIATSNAVVCAQGLKSWWNAVVLRNLLSRYTAAEIKLRRFGLRQVRQQFAVMLDDGSTRMETRTVEVLDIKQMLGDDPRLWSTT